ncbi:MAG: hypothetical protein DWP98_06305 [Bacteroidetes bacterium]|nr:MAG: hypothetical protein DWP98_06305 [Bacteroidota bacterium]MBL1143857.1 hypothetical protein [Bacteroidota bacterium]MCB0802444.1 hypothetical protein [Flavobacteriales bacterium]NOG56658.1 hypothetical protein [Bacteroidota bacterium]
MSQDEIRQSLSYGVYIEHSRSIKLAADENNKTFYKIANEFMTEKNRVKGLGLLSSSLMLYAISIELILKAVALYKETNNIISGEIKTYNDFLKKLKGKNNNGHEFKSIIEKYSINLTNSDLVLIGHLQDYTIWAGRFPFPIKENEIIKLENNNGSFGASLSLSYINEIDNIIEKLVDEII